MCCQVGVKTRQHSPARGLGWALGWAQARAQALRWEPGGERQQQREVVQEPDQLGTRVRAGGYEKPGTAIA